MCKYLEMIWKIPKIKISFFGLFLGLLDKNLDTQKLTNIYGINVKIKCKTYLVLYRVIKNDLPTENQTKFLEFPTVLADDDILCTNFVSDYC